MLKNKVFGRGKRRWVLLLAIVVALAVAYHYSKGGKKGESTRTATVETGTIDEVVTAQGKLEPKEYVSVGVQVSGQIKKLHVQVSDVVKKGQLLAEIDPRIYQSKVDQNTAGVKSLKAQVVDQQASLELAQRQHNRNLDMYKKKAISKDAMEQSEAALKQAKAKLASLDAQVDQLSSTLSADKTNLSYTKIYAPMDGVVALLPVREGQTVNSVQSAPTVMEIDNLDIMTVRAQVAEADIPRIQLNMPAYFTTLGDMDHKWQGTVRQIQQSPEIINDVVLYNVLIDAENPEHTLMNGMSTQIFFVLNSAANVLTLPIEALGTRLSKGDAGPIYEVKLRGGETRTVTVGIMDRTRAEIKDGLKAGDVVMVPPAKKASGTTRMPPGMAGPRL